MALITCPKCGAQVDDSTKFCPTCGASLTAQQAPTVTPQPTEDIASKVNLYLQVNASKFPSEQIPSLRSTLLRLSSSQLDRLSVVELKDPTIMLIFSLFLGSFGVDRFLLGQTGIGILKLLTCGAGGIWTIIDWFLVMGETRKYNYTRLLQNIQ